MGYSASSLDELGDGYGFRKVRAPLGVTAFGVNFLVYPPGYDGIGHYHETQDELYLVHRGRARFDVDGDTFELGEGGVVHVESTTVRRVSNAGDGDLVLLIVGGKDGYVQRDGHVLTEEDAERRRAISEGRMQG